VVGSVSACGSDKLLLRIDTESKPCDRASGPPSGGGAVIVDIAWRRSTPVGARFGGAALR
jgi:hypothetical protein